MKVGDRVEVDRAGIPYQGTIREFIGGRPAVQFDRRKGRKMAAYWQIMDRERIVAVWRNGERIE